MDTKVLKKLLGLGIVVTGFFFFTWFFQIAKISKLPMGSYHAWRQADCISVTNNFYDGNSTLLNPRTHYAKQDGTGLAAGEFPILYDAIAQVYKIVGKSEATYRKIIYFCYFVGLVFLFLLFFEISSHALLSALLALLLYSSSVLVYYAINFLPDVPALSLAIMGLYFITRAKRKERLGWYAVGLSIIALACLLKLTLMILLASTAVVLLVEIIMHGRKKFNLKALGIMGILMLIIFSWYKHAASLDHAHPPFIFLTETRSYFDTYFAERPLIWHDVVHKWLPQVFIPVVWLFILGGGGLGIFLSKKIKIEQVLFTSVSTLLAIVFFVLMYRQFWLHDYLWIGLLIIPVLFAMLLLKAMASAIDKNARYAFIIFSGFLLVLQSFNTRLILKERYFKFDNSWVYNQNLLGLKEELRKHGIKKTDLVISIPDPSPNISLVLMDQYGFTNYREDNKDSLSINHSIERGAKYLIVSDNREYEKEYLKPFLKNMLFEYKGIGVFKVVLRK